MSSVKVQGNAGGVGVFTLQSPNSANTQTLTLPDATATLVGDTATQTLTNKTLGTGTVQTVSLIRSGTSQASTSGTSIDFTGIPSWVKRVTVMFNGVSTSGTSVPLIQIGSGSFTTSGYSGSAGSIVGTTPGSASFTTGFGLVNNVHTAAATISGAITLTLLSGNTWTASGVTAYDSGGVRFTGGVLALSGALDRVRITTVNGTDTFDAGSINILYE